MPIVPETLKTFREERRLSQQGLAERASLIKGASVSKRTISRIESGEIAPEKVRNHTLKSLALVLDVDEDALCKAPTANADAQLKVQEAGYKRIVLWLGKDVRLNYRCVTHHYDVSAQDLIDAAPWMFTLLAEMSLADRKRRLKEADASFEAAMAQLPGHLGHGQLARGDFENVAFDEKNSLVCRDIFGQKVLEGADERGHGDVLDPNMSNPFFDFLQRTAKAIDSDAIDAELVEPSFGGMPCWPVFDLWLNQLTGDDAWARFAVENVRGVVDALPENLKGEEKTAERVQWLIDQIPADMKALEEERLAKWKAQSAAIVL